MLLGNDAANLAAPDLAKALQQKAKDLYEAIHCPYSKTNAIVLLFPYSDPVQNSGLEVPEEYRPQPATFRLGFVLYGVTDPDAPYVNIRGSIVQVSPYNIIPILGYEELVAVDPNHFVCRWCTDQVAKMFRDTEK